MSPDVTAVITTHARSARVREALASVRLETHPSIEVIIVDDGGAYVATAFVLSPLVRQRKQQRGIVEPALPRVVEVDMNAITDWALKFVRWGSGLGIAGLITGYFPLGHYLMKDSLPSCPAARVHRHTILLSFVGMTLFGLVYGVLPQWLGTHEPPLTLIRVHFWLVTIGTIGVCLNGTIGYEVLGMFVQPEFYYIGQPGQAVRNLWFAVDGVFLTMYGAGSGIFLYVLLKHTAYAHAEAKS